MAKKKKRLDTEETLFDDSVVGATSDENLDDSSETPLDEDVPSDSVGDATDENPSVETYSPPDEEEDFGGDPPYTPEYVTLPNGKRALIGRK